MTVIVVSVAVMLAPSIASPAPPGAGVTPHLASLSLPLVVDGEPSSSFVARARPDIMAAG